MSIPCFKHGTSIRVFLKETGEIYEGTYCGGSDNRVDINNITDNKGQKLVGVYSYYDSEIEKIQVKEVKEEEKEPVEEPTSSVDVKRLYTFDFPNGEVDRLKNIAQEAPIFYNTGEEFDRALNILKESENVGLMALGIDENVTKLQFLVMGTRYNIFIFDAIKYTKKKFPVELKKLLESEENVKVIHQKNILERSLQQYEVKLKNYYDIQESDSEIHQKQTKSTEKINRNTSEILQDVLNIPDSILYKALETNKSVKKWEERPLRDTRRLSAALLCTFLISGKYGLEYESYKDVYRITRNVYDHVANMDSLQFLKSVYKENFQRDVQRFIVESKLNQK
ncbi:unnamed protein product [Brassicogethes aeneus]|uniref:Uncharacterized protein n=1 Tax=Brassicogethes aeneus TaxID=1431903 RepID=A0A9P0FPX4_BRAAE|nr:unnamed protein product [Brassicogethes aeneus]